jgi:TusA-related sulfurtransferase
VRDGQGRGRVALQHAGAVSAARRPEEALMAGFDRSLDARGLNCPMPIIKARQELNHLQPGQVLQVLSTDRGSVKDFQGWAKTARNIELVAQEDIQQDGKPVYVHYVKRLS